MQYGNEMPEKIAVVSDFHNTVFGNNNLVLIDAIRKEAPDLILIPGDAVTNDREENRIAAAFLKELSHLSIPVLYAIGNHEEKFRRRSPERYQAYLEGLKKCGIQVLDNAWYRYADHVNVAGLTIPYAYYTKGFRKKVPTPGEIQKYLQEPPEGIRIMMAHNPCFFEAYAAYGADVILSGHIHGGIIRLPKLGGVVSPQWKLFPKYDAGLFRKGKSAMLVSRGIGDHIIRFRLSNPYELMIVDFKKH